MTAERISGDAPAEGLWFTDLLRLSLLGAKARQGNEQIIAVKQAWCHQWGYGEEHSEGRVAPFSTKCPGLLVWPNTPASRCGGNGRFIAQAKLRTGKVFVPVEELYCGATFGLLALDLLTTTGMRSNELYQVSLSPECLIRLVDDPPPGARDQSPRIRYVLRLLPKGAALKHDTIMASARKRSDSLRRLPTCYVPIIIFNQANNCLVWPFIPITTEATVLNRKRHLTSFSITTST